MASENKQRTAFEREVVELLGGLLAWIKLETRPRVAARLADILDSSEKKLVYEYSDGKRGVREIGEMTGVDKNTISTWWGEWEGLGIMERAKTWKGRRKRLVSLEDVGIEVPALPRRREK